MELNKIALDSSDGSEIASAIVGLAPGDRITIGAGGQIASMTVMLESNEEGMAVFGVTDIELDSEGDVISGDEMVLPDPMSPVAATLANA